MTFLRNVNIRYCDLHRNPLSNILYNPHCNFTASHYLKTTQPEEGIVRYKALKNMIWALTI